MKKEIIVLTATGILIGSLGFVGAQSTQSNTQSGGADTQTQSQTQSQTQDSTQTKLSRGFGDDFGRGFGRGSRGLPFGRHLALGTTVTLEFYASDPGTDGTGTPEQTLNFTYGQDSEAAFAQSFADARANSSYMTVNVGEQTQTLQLPSDTSTDTSNSDSGFGRGDRRGGVYGALSLRGLNEGSSVTATFYDGDPAGDAQTLQTLSFTYGQDSEAGFVNDFAAAAENAAYVTITTSPQTTTVDLSETASGRGEGARGDFAGLGDHRSGPGGRR